MCARRLGVTRIANHARDTASDFRSATQPLLVIRGQPSHQPLYAAPLQATVEPVGQTFSIIFDRYILGILADQTVIAELHTDHSHSVRIVQSR